MFKRNTKVFNYTIVFYVKYPHRHDKKLFQIYLVEDAEVCSLTLMSMTHESVENGEQK